MRNRFGLTAGTVCAGVVLAVCVAPVQDATVRSETDMQAQFDRIHMEWLAHRQHVQGMSSQMDFSRWFEGPAWESILQLGVRAVPQIIERLPQDHALGHALHHITGFRYHVRRTGEVAEASTWVVEEFPDIARAGGPPDAVRIWQRWYVEGREWVPERFNELQYRYQNATAAEDAETAEAALEAITKLGVAVLPSLMERIRAGDDTLVGVVAAITGNAIAPDSSGTECLHWWEANQQDWLIPWLEETPQ